jgi:hypothetical protein
MQGTYRIARRLWSFLESDDRRSEMVKSAWGKLLSGDEQLASTPNDDVPPRVNGRV